MSDTRKSNKSPNSKWYLPNTDGVLSVELKNRLKKGIEKIGIHITKTLELEPPPDRESTHSRASASRDDGEAPSPLLNDSRDPDEEEGSSDDSSKTLAARQSQSSTATLVPRRYRSSAQPAHDSPNVGPSEVRPPSQSTFNCSRCGQHSLDCVC